MNQVIFFYEPIHINNQTSSSVNNTNQYILKIQNLQIYISNHKCKMITESAKSRCKCKSTKNCKIVPHFPSQIQAQIY